MTWLVLSAVLTSSLGVALGACNPPPPRGRSASGVRKAPPPPPTPRADDSVCSKDGGAELEGCADPMPRCMEVWRDAAAVEGPEPDCASLLAD